MTLGGCIGIGFCAASQCRTKVKVIRNFLDLLDCIILELSSRVTPLPDLCRAISAKAGQFQKTIGLFADALDNQVAPDPSACMEYAIGNKPASCPEFSQCLREPAGVLGCYDLSGQIRQVENLRS